MMNIGTKMYTQETILTFPSTGRKILLKPEEGRELEQRMSAAGVERSLKTQDITEKRIYALIDKLREWNRETTDVKEILEKIEQDDSDGIITDSIKVAQEVVDIVTKEITQSLAEEIAGSGLLGFDHVMNYFNRKE